jgi:hypothetical protein
MLDPSGLDLQLQALSDYRYRRRLRPAVTSWQYPRHQMARRT